MIGVDKDSRVERVTKYLINRINSGEYSLSGKLPSIDKLAKELGIGRSTIRESLKELQTLGIVEIKHGEGTYLSTYFSLSPSEHGKYPLAVQTVDARRAIEMYCAEYAANTANEGLIQTLTDIYKKMEECIYNKNLDFFIYYDRIFHYHISQHTSNVLIIRYHTSLELLFDDVQRMIVNLPESCYVAQRDHMNLIQAIRDQNPKKAALFAGIHIDNIARQVNEVLHI